MTGDSGGTSGCPQTVVGRSDGHADRISGDQPLFTHSSIEEGIDQFVINLERIGRTQRTISSYRRDLLQFASFLHPRVGGGRPTVESLQSDLVGEYVDQLGRRLKPATVARKRSVIRSFSHFLCRQGLLQRYAALAPAPAPAHGRPPIDAEQIEEALSATAGDEFGQVRDRAILEITYATGLRLDELIGTNLSSLDLAGGLLTVKRGDRIRSVPLGPSARNALASYLLARAEQLMRLPIESIDAGALFISRAGRRLHRRSVQRIVEHLLADFAAAPTDLPSDGQGHSSGRLGAQSLRRACADHLVSAGAEVAAVRSLLGQQSLPRLSECDDSFEALRRRYDLAHPRAREP